MVLDERILDAGSIRRMVRITDRRIGRSTISAIISGVNSPAVVVGVVRGCGLLHSATHCVSYTPPVQLAGRWGSLSLEDILGSVP